MIKVSEKAVEEFPYSTTLKTYRVRALMETGRIEDAKGLAFELLKSNPGSSVIHDLLAKVYEREGSNRKAVDEYMKILFLNPGDREVELQVERLKPSSSSLTTEENNPPQARPNRALLPFRKRKRIFLRILRLRFLWLNRKPMRKPRSGLLGDSQRGPLYRAPGGESLRH